MIGLKPPLKKQVSLYLCQRSSGKKLKEIGAYFGIGELGVSQAARRAQARIETDTKFRVYVDGIGKKLNLLRVKT